MPNPLEPKLEIKVALLQSGSSRIELSFDDPNDDAAGRALSGKAMFDFPALEKAKRDDTEYGQLLTSMLFGDVIIRDFFTEVKAKASDCTLRLRLFLDADSAELNNLRWELLCDPNDDQFLTASERILFSRFVVSGKWTPVKIRARSELRALIAVSDPTDLPAVNMGPVRKDIEVPAARKALAAIRHITVLGENEPVTLEALLREIRNGADIVYLVCHGSYVKEPVLFLQDETGALKFATGEEFSEAIRQLAEPPRLMVLASCESAGRNGRFAESALAPLLADAGIPAIVAMQAKVSMDTVAKMMPEFFNEISRDGKIDRAMAVARSVALRANANDAWMPALFLRLKSGSIWKELVDPSDLVEELRRALNRKQLVMIDAIPWDRYTDVEAGKMLGVLERAVGEVLVKSAEGSKLRRPARLVSLWLLDSPGGTELQKLAVAAPLIPLILENQVERLALEARTQAELRAVLGQLNPVRTWVKVLAGVIGLAATLAGLGWSDYRHLPVEAQAYTVIEGSPKGDWDSKEFAWRCDPKATSIKPGSHLELPDAFPGGAQLSMVSGAAYYDAILHMDLKFQESVTESGWILRASQIGTGQSINAAGYHFELKFSDKDACRIRLEAKAEGKFLPQVKGPKCVDFDSYKHGEDRITVLTTIKDNVIKVSLDTQDTPQDKALEFEYSDASYRYLYGNIGLSFPKGGKTEILEFTLSPVPAASRFQMYRQWRIRSLRKILAS